MPRNQITVAATAAMVLLLAAPNLRASMFGLDLTASALNTIVLDESLDDLIFLSVNTGFVDNGLGSSGQAFASANLATGEIKISGQHSGVNQAAGSSGLLFDTLNFALPIGMPSASITATLAVTGTFSDGTQPVGQDILPGGNALIQIGSELGGAETGGGFVPLVGFIPGMFSATMLVTPATGDVRVTASLHGVAIGENWYNLTNTAAVGLTVPDGVTFTSG